MVWIENMVLLEWARALERIGLGPVTEVIDEDPSLAPGGNDNAVGRFEVAGLAIRILRDRGEYTVDIGPPTRPHDLEWLADIRIAMGWLSLEEVVDSPFGPTLTEELEVIRARLSDCASRLARLPAARE